MEAAERAHPPRLAALLACGLALAPAAAARADAPESVRFLVAENPAGGACSHCDSYVLPLSAQADIAAARDLIARGGTGGGTIAVAHVAAGADGVNRDWLAPGAPAWSWHVSDFVGFADTTVEILDGWPGFVESDVDGWIANTNGTIGFWSYTVVQELPEPGAGVAQATALAALLLLARGIPALAARRSLHQACRSRAP
jgi:hypothetical protein